MAHVDVVRWLGSHIERVLAGILVDDGPVHLPGRLIGVITLELELSHHIGRIAEDILASDLL